MYEINDVSVMTVKEVKTKKQTAIVKEFYCYKNKILLTSDKTNILSDGNDSTIITCQRQTFSLDTGGYVNVTDIAPIILDVNGTSVLVDDVVDGVGQLEFASLEAGSYTIKSNNDLTENTEVEVIVG